MGVIFEGDVGIGFIRGLFCDLLANFNYLIARSANEHNCAIKNWVYVASHQNIYTNKVIVSVKYSIYVMRAGTYSN